MIGRPVRRSEDGPLLRGRAQFLADIDLPGAVHAAFLRSPHAHARVASIDCTGASMSGVQCVLAGQQLALAPLVSPLETTNCYSPPRPVLATDRVRFVGEALAVAVADQRYLAEDAIERILVRYEPLPVVADVTTAMAADAPRLHDWPSNVLFDSTLEVGDVAAAFAQAAAVVERTFRNPRYSAAPIEPRGVLAVPTAGGVYVQSSTQIPHRLRALLAEILGLAAEQVRVTCPDVGGGFGQKAHCYPEEIVVAWLALKLGRPVKWLEDRRENLLAASHAREQAVRVRAAADAHGRLLAVDADVICDQGAYGSFPHGHVLEALGTPTMIPGPYRLDCYRARARSVATNKCPGGAYRGVGLPVSAFVHERVMDILAQELRLDRAEIRRRNYVRPGDFPYVTVTRQRYDSGDYGAALELALTEIGYDSFGSAQARARAEGRLLGIGLASYVEYTGMGSHVFQSRGMVGIAGFDGAHVALQTDGTATVWTTLPGMGQGVQTTFGQLVAEYLRLDVGAVNVERCDTDVGGLDGTGTFASRSAVAGGGAIRLACAELRGRILEDTAARLEVAVEDLELGSGVVRIVGMPSSGVRIAELVRAAKPGRFAVSCHFDPPAVAYPYATHACLVEVDKDTGRVDIRKYVIAEDCGTVINPPIMEGQVHGATAQGIGGTLFESLLYDGEGQLQTATLMDYLVPTAAEIPDFEIGHLAMPAPGSPTGAKGVGEGGTLAPPAAIANAVADALGCELNELPLTPQRLIEYCPNTGERP